MITIYGNYTNAIVYTTNNELFAIDEHARKQLQMICNHPSAAGSKIRITAPKRLSAPEIIRTMPYPGFPTDCQALVMSAAAVADGVTFINENIFENRFRHTSELCRMGADIRVYDKLAVVRGVESLQGACVNATDLRAGAALVVAGLCAEGVTTVNSIQYIDRGYDSLEENLTSLGARIRRND